MRRASDGRDSLRVASEQREEIDASAGIADVSK